MEEALDLSFDRLLMMIIKQKMYVVRSLLDDINTKQLQWYGHVQRMGRGEVTKRSYEVEPTRKKKTR